MKITVTLSSILAGPVQFQFQSETEQSFLYDFRFCLFDGAQSALSLRSIVFFRAFHGSVAHLMR